VKVHVGKGRANGNVVIPGSKSVAHRYLIAAAFVNGTTDICHLPDNDDINATIRCLRALGAVISKTGDTATVFPADGIAPTGTLLDCKESGTTLRLLIPQALLTGREVTFVGSGRLFARPLDIYENICRAQNIEWKQTENSLTVHGRLQPGNFSFPGNISSQFVSGLLFALPHLDGKSTLSLTGGVESAPYINLTLDALKKFGFEAFAESAGKYSVCGNQHGTSAGRLNVPTDQSSAAFFGALNALGGSVTLKDFYDDGTQGDRVWNEYFNALICSTPTLSVADCPDLAPIIMAVAAVKNGVTLIDTARLRFKESDRGNAMAKELQKCGVSVDARENSIIVSGGAKAPHEHLYGHNDHRIAMSLAVLLTATGGGTIDDAECVAKSLPDFWKMLAALGISITPEKD